MIFQGNSAVDMVSRVEMLGLIISSISLIVIILSWRATTITSIYDKEMILQERYKGVEFAGENFRYKITGLSTHKNPGNSRLYPIKVYWRGKVIGSTELQLKFENSGYVPSRDQLETHPWYTDLELQIPIVDQATPPGMVLFISSVEPEEINYRYFPTSVIS